MDDDLELCVEKDENSQYTYLKWKWMVLGKKGKEHISGLAKDKATATFNGNIFMKKLANPYGDTT